MKVAVSIPDSVFIAAEAYAKDNRLSRSKLYAMALEDMLERQFDRSSMTTESINAALDAIGEDGSDPFVDAAGHETLRPIDW